MPTTYAIPNGRTVMDATLWTGDNTNPRTIQNADLGTTGFKPDLVWVKARNSGQFHVLNDSVRGAGTAFGLSSQSTSAEGNADIGLYGATTAFNSNGFSVGAGTSNQAFVNLSGVTYVGWQWQAGQGTNLTNTTGTITSTVSVNTTAGFSVVTYTGTVIAGTIGHGLGVAPQMIIVKNRSNGVRNWVVYHSNLTSASYYLILNLTNAQSLDTGIWNATAPTSSVFSIGNAAEDNESGASMVAYCWTPIAGFSQFGSYTGNGSTDGPFIYTGFRPKFIMRKNITQAYGWYMDDTSRNPSNVIKDFLLANSSAAEVLNDTNYALDIVSNGFKVRSSHITQNYSGDTYIYMAYAENPFKFANAC